MKVLHLSKTTHGARWASAQALVLARKGVEVHVVLPDLDGPVAKEWISNGAQIHRTGYTFSLLKPVRTNSALEQLRRLVDRIQPDLVHCHSVIAAIMARLALRRYPSLPRIFQVPGPIHMEKSVFRALELATATASDCWIATSRAILSHYLAAGISSKRVFLSYSGTENGRFRHERKGWLRERLGLDSSDFVVGNISYIYSPKWYLQQTVGLKCHEDLIDGISIAAEQQRSIRGVLIGGPWGRDTGYFAKLRQYAQKRSGRVVLMPGFMTQDQVPCAIRDFDCVAHVPLSENCGGVVEPLLCAIPTIASRVGGLGEVVMDGLTGITVPVHHPVELAKAILHVYSNHQAATKLADSGRMLVTTMFDVNRTALEVYEIYRYLLGLRVTPPEEFHSREFLQEGLATTHTNAKFGCIDAIP